MSKCFEVHIQSTVSYDLQWRLMPMIWVKQKR